MIIKTCVPPPAGKKSDQYLMIWLTSYQLPTTIPTSTESGYGIRLSHMVFCMPNINNRMYVRMK
ncbi:hypothetical protein B7P43_G00380 [Cryptotermes secundus]|uniref:Uncharacterized protein n=1 Tax=Cryptotermes secundus TaxID=105785 RepID=A0A2J7R8H5_9NEOP|nr:hypothetical protein B7P43_G00380 [Cryptotermes secundus]